MIMLFGLPFQGLVRFDELRNNRTEEGWGYIMIVFEFYI